MKKKTYRFPKLSYYIFRHTIPQGEWQWLDSNDYPYPRNFKLKYTFDFFNYAGIHRDLCIKNMRKITKY